MVGGGAPVLAFELSKNKISRVKQAMDSGTFTPRNVSEYLTGVRLEAASIPDIITVESSSSHVLPFFSSSSSSSSSSYMPKHVPFALTSPLLTTPHWRQKVVLAFQTLGRMMQSHRGSSERIVVPKLRDLDGWHHFCFGNEQGRNNTVISEEEDDDDHDLLTHALSDTAQGRHGWPSLRLLVQFDQVVVTKLLSYHIGWLTSSSSSSPVGISNERAVWLYALLARLNTATPLDSTTAGNLRTLLRHCLSWHHSLHEAQETVDLLAPSFMRNCRTVELLLVLLVNACQQGDGQTLMEMQSMMLS